MSQSTSTFSYESQGTTVYVSVGKLPPIRRLCQVCQKPLSGRGMWKFCPDHAQEAYYVSSHIRKLRNDDKLRVQVYTLMASEDYVSEKDQRKHAVFPSAGPKRSGGRKCPRCEGRMKKTFGLWECTACGYNLE